MNNNETMPPVVHLRSIGNIVEFYERHICKLKRFHSQSFYQQKACQDNTTAHKSHLLVILCNFMVCFCVLTWYATAIQGE